MVTAGDDIVEQGPRGPRRLGTAVVAALLLAIPLIVVLTGRDTGPPQPSREPSGQVITPRPVRQAAGVTPNAVYPAATGTGGTRRLRVTFPDGSRAEVTYPDGLSLAALGARPYTGASLTGDGGEQAFRTLSAPLYGEAETAAGRPMIRRVAEGVTLWPGPLGEEGAGPVLLFGFGDWRIALRDEPAPMTFEQRLAWARNLRGTLTPDGFLTLSAGGPLRLSRPGETRDGVLVGPQLWLGGLSRRMVVLAPVPGCRHKPSVVLDPRHRIAGSRCHDGFYLAASGDPDFVRGVLEEVRVGFTA